MNFSLIDTHAHLTSEQILPDVDAVLTRAKQNHISKIVNICTDVKSLKAGIALYAKYPWVFNTAATTPHDVKEEGEAFFPLVKEAAQKKQLIAIGETGLDYFYEHAPKKIQQDFLSRYFALAIAVDLPLIFHCREAFADLFRMADEEYQNRSAVLHCFTGTLEEAKGVLERGWYLSLSGIITFKKSDQLREVAKYVPLDRLFLETDAPYLAPQKRRGERNEPAFLIETAQELASIKGVPFDELAQATKENAQRFFSFEKLK